MTNAANHLILLEHVNLNVGDADIAARFYVDGLGLCVDPARETQGKSMHVNVGPFCQFHTASPVHEPYITAEGPQIWRGSITIAYRLEQLQRCVARLSGEVGTSLRGTKFFVAEPADNCGSCHVTCPFGNQFVLVAASAEEVDAFNSVGPGRPGSEDSMALGFVSISLPVANAFSGKIASFYERCLGLAWTVPSAGRVEIKGGPRGCQKLEFIETDGDVPPYTGDHFCFYVADLKACFEGCKQAGVVWVNPRFSHLDASETWEDCVTYKQFRSIYLLNICF